MVGDHPGDGRLVDFGWLVTILAIVGYHLWDGG